MHEKTLRLSCNLIIYSRRVSEHIALPFIQECLQEVYKNTFLMDDLNSRQLHYITTLSKPKKYCVHIFFLFKSTMSYFPVFPEECSLYLYIYWKLMTLI